MSEITKKELEHLAELARIEIEAPTPADSLVGVPTAKRVGKEKLQKDLENILNYFKELQGVNTEGVEPMAGGTELKNVVREDESVTSKMRQAMGIEDDTGKGPEQFPDKQDGYLKVPPVF